MVERRFTVGSQADRAPQHLCWQRVPRATVSELFQLQISQCSCQREKVSEFIWTGGCTGK